MQGNKIKRIVHFCLQPTMKDEVFEETDNFLKIHKEMFTSFNDLDLSNVAKKSLFDKLLSLSYYTIRKIKKNGKNKDIDGSWQYRHGGNTGFCP